MKEPCVYILANRPRGVLYVGVTSCLPRRVQQHKDGFYDGFTSRCHLYVLVFYESLPSMRLAIAREKRLKKWKRAWKIALIEKHNPSWDDLALAWCDEGLPEQARGSRDLAGYDVFDEV